MYKKIGLFGLFGGVVGISPPHLSDTPRLDKQTSSPISVIVKTNASPSQQTNPENPTASTPTKSTASSTK